MPRTLNDIIESLPSINAFSNSYRKSAEDKLTSFGIPDNRFEMEVPKYPSDVTLLSDDELGRYLSAYLVTAGFLRKLIALKESDILFADATLSRFVKTKVHEGMKKADAEREEDAVALEGSVMELGIQLKVVQGRWEHFDACAKALSRELTRRVGSKGNSQV